MDIAIMMGGGRETMELSRWYRIDKQTGQIEYVGRTGSSTFQHRVWSNATAYFKNVVEVIDSGRFQTPFAIFSREDLITESERTGE